MKDNIQIAIISKCPITGKTEEYLFDDYESATNKVTEIKQNGSHIEVEIDLFENTLLSDEEIDQIFAEVEEEFAEAEQKGE